MVNLGNYISSIDEAQRDVAKIKRFNPDDEWTDNCLKALEDAFSKEYTIEKKWSGSICFYKKGKKPSLKSLVCSINGNSYIDFGPNTSLENTLGEEIFNVIDTVE